jgi:hypothetical protein
VREPDPMSECRPGGSCPDCNAPDDTLEDDESSPECDWCGKPSAGKFCSRGCRKAFESDRA